MLVGTTENHRKSSNRLMHYIIATCPMCVSFIHHVHLTICEMLNFHGVQTCNAAKPVALECVIGTLAKR